MMKFLIRLDDACPTMHHKKWEEMEELLNTYDIRPIVGIIPDNKDPKFDWNEDPDFWTTTAKRYRDKKWCIAQHGMHHVYQSTIKSEFCGLLLQDQKYILKKGYDLLCSKNLTPTCFFAPAHAFDDITLLAIKELGCYRFMSDGLAFYPYYRNGVLLVPSLFDTPHKIAPFGIYTFVYHPNAMTQKQFEDLNRFLKNNKKIITDVDSVLSEHNWNQKRSAIDYTIGASIQVLRKLRKFF